MGVVYALVLSIAPAVRGMAAEAGLEGVGTWVQRGIVLLVALGVVSIAAADQSATRRKTMVLAGLVITALGVVTSSGVFVALLIAAFGFWRLERALIVLGGLGFAGHLTVYYYQLDLTLLHKSLVLMASGLVLLGIRWWYTRRDRVEAG